MWSRLDDALLDHRKVLHAAELLGPNGRAIAIGLHAAALMYANKHLTDGFVPLSAIQTWQLANAVDSAAAMVRSALWTRAKRHGIEGYQVHDFGAYNHTAADVLAYRDREAKRKRRARRSWKSAKAARKNGHG